MYNITAITKGESIYLRYYDSPMPNRMNYYFGRNQDCTEKYDNDLIAWQQSVKEVKVHESCKEILLHELVKEWQKIRSKEIAPSFTKHLEKGIPCDFLKERIEIVKEHPGEAAGYSKNAEWIYWAILKPLDLPIEERQEETKLNKEAKDMWGMLEEINTIMWESYMIKDRSFGRTDGLKIMKVLEHWAEKY